MSYKLSEEDVDLINKLKLVEERVWTKFFPEEQETFRHTAETIGKNFYKNIQAVNKDVVTINAYGYTQMPNESFKKVIDKFYQTVPVKIEKKIQNEATQWRDFLPRLLNTFTFEIVNDENLKLHQKIIALACIKDGIDKVALYANVNLFSPYQVALAYIDKEIKTHIERYDAQIKALLDAIAKPDEEDAYYWPGTAEQLEHFYILLKKYDLIEPNPNYRFSFQEKFAKENQLIWIAENKQLIYLFFLLYGGNRAYKGRGIHDIADHVFDKKDGSLKAHNLNTQLARLISTKKKTIISGTLDDKLRKMDELIKEYNSPVASVQLTATT